MLLVALFMPWAANAQETVTIGDGTATDYYTPIGTYYNYSITEQLYTAEEIGMAGTISSIGFSYASSTAKDFPMAVYMANVEATDLSTGISLADADEVFNGTLSVTEAGWATITLDSPFDYDGTSNLLIGIIKDYVKWYSGNTWYHTTTDVVMTRYTQNDNNAYTTSTVPGTTITARPNIQILITPASLSCDRPTNLTVSNILVNQATFSWTENGEATEWQICVNGDDTNLIIADSNPFSLTGLDSETTYSVRVRAFCDDTDQSAWSNTLNFTTAEVCPDDMVCIGTGFATNDYLPIECDMSNSLTEQIYTAAEIGEAGAILIIDFYKPNEIETVKDLDIYMVSTTKDEFEDDFDWIPVTENDLVYSGTVTFANNDWTTIELDIPFIYDGTSNVCIVVDNNGGGVYNTTTFRVFTTEKNQANHLAATHNLDPTSTPEIAWRFAEKNRIRLGFGEPPACPKPTGVKASNVSTHQATINWISNADAFQIQLNEENPIVTMQTQYTFHNLTPEMTYSVKVRANCGGTYSDWSMPVNFTTGIACYPPIGVSVSNITGHNAVVSWTSDADDFSLMLGEEVIEHVTSPYALTGLTPETTYTVKVKALCGGDDGDSQWTSGTNFTTIVACPDPTDLTVGLTPGNGSIATLSWAEHGDATAWKICLVGDDITYINADSNPFQLTGLTPETTYSVKVKSVCGEDGDSENWTNTVTFTPTNSYWLTVNEATNTNEYVPIYGYWCDAFAKSQFIIPAADLAEMQWDTINRMTFYASNESVNWGDARFEVYMTETDETTLSALADFSDMEKIMNVGTLFISGNQMEVVFDAPFYYKGNNLMIGFLQTVKGSSVHSYWYGVSALGASIGGYTSTSGTDNFAQQNFLPQITFYYVPGEAPSCLPPTDFAVNYTGGTTAELSWTENGTATAWQICVNEDEEHLMDVTTNPYTLTDLIYETSYTVKVRANCGNDQSYWSNTVSFDCTAKHIIGSGTATYSYLPLNNYYKYSLTEQIYTVEELGEAGYITSIDFYKSATVETVRDLKIYMVNTEKNAFESTSDWVIVTADDLVYSGTVTFADNAWTSIEFDDGFAYDGTHNIVLVVDDNTGSYKSSTSWLAFSVGEQTQAIYKYSDSDNYDPTGTPGTASGITDIKNQIRILKGVEPTCKKPKALTVVGEPGNHSVTLSWIEKGEATAWQICLNGDEEHLIEAESNPFIVTGLNAETDYTVKVRGNCSEDDQSAWSDELAFTTNIPCPAPTFGTITTTPFTATLNWTGFSESYNLRYAEYEAPEGAAWMQYDDANFATSIGNSSVGTWQWGVMYPSSMLNSNTFVSKVSFYEREGSNTEDITISIYSGGDSEPETLLYTEIVSPAGTSGFHEIILAQQVAIDPTVNLWVTLSEKGTYVMSSCATTEANNQWVYNDGTWANIGDLSSSLAGYGWMIRAYLTSYDPSTATWIDEITGITTTSYEITDLTAEKDYVVQVMGDCGIDGLSLWRTAYFTTASACEAPFDLEATEVLTNDATLRWNGYQDEYNIRYREVLFTDFDDSSMGGWTTIDADGDGYDWVLGSECGGIYLASGSSLVGSGHESSQDFVTSGSYRIYSEGGGGVALTPDNYLVSPQIILGGSISFWACAQDARYAAEHFGVAVSTTGNTDAADFTTIQEWTLTAKGTGAKANPSTTRSGNRSQGTWYKYTVDLSAYSGQGYVAIRHFNCTDMFLLDIDDIEIASSSWTVNTGLNNTEVTISSLAAETTYVFQVQGVNAGCTGGLTDWSESFYFTTLADKPIAVVDGGYWNNDATWINSGGHVPAEGTSVYVSGDVIIPANYTAIAGEITIVNDGSLTIQDGGQLQHSNEIPAMVNFTYNPSNSKDGDYGIYRLIASPINPSVAVSSTGLMPASDNDNYDYVDLYCFNQDSINEWINYKYTANNFTTVDIAKGYLYANRQAVQSTFAGYIIPTNVDYPVDLTYTEGNEFAGLNLVGNPYTCNAYVNMSYFKLDATGSEVSATACSDAIAPLQGVFVHSDAEGQKATFTTTAPGKSLNLNITVNHANAKVDNAIVSFGNGTTLEKFQFDPNHTKVYMPVEGKDYAVAKAENEGEMPVCFKAQENGTYTLYFNSEEVSFNYLHLIDNLTGNDVDLLENPNYSFDARTTDYASRFKLVFATGNTNGNVSNFGFISDGNLMILGIEGEATLQIIDVTGRILSTETFSGSYSKAVNEATGIYMLRLIQGSDVRTQKIVIK